MYRQVPGGVQQVGAARGRARRRARRRPARPQPGGAVRRRRRAALPGRDPRRLPLRDRRRGPPVGRRRWCSSPTPGRCARSGCTPARDPAALPAPARRPDQLGDRAAARRDERPERAVDERRSARLPRARPTTRPALVDRADAPPPPRPDPGHRAGVVPASRGRRTVFHDELDQVAHAAAATTSSPAAGGRVVGYGGLMFVGRRGPRHEHRRPPRRTGATGVGHAAARRPRRRGRSTAAAQAWTLEVRASSTRRPGAVPRVRLRAGRRPRAVLREHRGRHRDVVPRHPDAEYARRLEELPT